MKVALFLVVALCAVTFASQHERTVIAGENRFFKPDTWKVGVEAPLDGKIDIYIFMVQSNLDKLDEVFNKATTPGEPEWRHWWTSDEVKNLIATPPAQKFKVARWLKSAGVDRSSVVDMKDTLKVTTTIEIASALFETKFYTFQHIASGTIVYRQLGAYSIPTAVTSVIEFVTGVSEFPFATRKFGYSRPAKLDDEEGKVVPYVIDQLYSIPYAQKSSVTKRTSVGVVEYQGDRSFSQTDLTYFQQQNNLPQQQVPTAQIVGPYEPSEPDAEATLDIQYAWGVSYNTSAWYWTVEGWLLEWAVEFQNTPAPKPSVVSMSWGWTEDNQCEIAPCTDSSTYVDRVNTEFKAIGVSGVTITASSGDQGAPGDGDDNCRNTKEPLSSIFPGASPYVLSIGATMLVNNNSTTSKQADPSQPKPPICSTYTCASVSTTEEVACSYPEALITTGGGFSDYSTRPSWQNAVVTSYLNVVPPSSLPPASSFNANNRGFPDVSALGHNYLIRRDNTWEDVDGTSCSAPVWAGIISLFNEYEVANGRPVLGFINPLIYQAYGAEANAFNDIVNGDNKCSESECCEYGYVTAIGWDPVTGLGSPNFGTLYSYIQTQSATLYKQ